MNSGLPEWADKHQQTQEMQQQRWQWMVDSSRLHLLRLLKRVPGNTFVLFGVFFQMEIIHPFLFALLCWTFHWKVGGCFYRTLCLNRLSDSTAPFEIHRENSSGQCALSTCETTINKCVTTGHIWNELYFLIAHGINSNINNNNNNEMNSTTTITKMYILYNLCIHVILILLWIFLFFILLLYNNNKNINYKMYNITTIMY